MEAIEIAVYLVIAVIAGSLIYYFVGTAGFQDLSEGLRNEKKVEFRKVDTKGFIEETVFFWQSCGLGEVSKSTTLYVSGTGALNKTDLFDGVKKLNHCSTLQSSAYGCGTKEDVVMGNFTLPHVIRLECNSTLQKLILS
jgi:hypothetical protein